MTPGPIGINSATYIGYSAPQLAGFTGVFWGILGSMICTTVVVIPPFILSRYATHLFSRHSDSLAVKAVFAGLRPVIIGSAALLLMNSANFGESTPQIIISIIICAITFLIVYFTKIHPILVIIAAGIAGFIIY